MTNPEPDEAVEFLKTDLLGRVRVRPEQREKLLDAVESSGMSGQAFATNHGVKVQTFASWIQKRRKMRGDYGDEAIRRKLRMPGSRTGQSDPSHGRCLNLIEVEVRPDTGNESAPILEVVLPGGAVARISSESQVQLLKILLRELPC